MEEACWGTLLLGLSYGWYLCSNFILVDRQTIQDRGTFQHCSEYPRQSNFNRILKLSYVWWFYFSGGILIIVSWQVIVCECWTMKSVIILEASNHFNNGSWQFMMFGLIRWCSLYFRVTCLCYLWCHPSYGVKRLLRHNFISEKTICLDSKNTTTSMH